MDYFLAGVFLGGGTVALIAAAVYMILANNAENDTLHVWDSGDRRFAIVEIEAPDA